MCARSPLNTRSGLPGISLHSGQARYNSWRLSQTQNFVLAHPVLSCPFLSSALHDLGHFSGCWSKPLKTERVTSVVYISLRDTPSSQHIPAWRYVREMWTTSNTLSSLQWKPIVVASKGTSTKIPFKQSSMRLFVWNLDRTSASKVSLIAVITRKRERETLQVLSISATRLLLFHDHEYLRPQIEKSSYRLKHYMSTC